MKKIKKGIFLLILTLLLSGCGHKIESINYQGLEKLEKNKENFILEVIQNGCSHCEEFTPRFEKIVKKYKIKNVYKLNLSKMSKEEKKKFTKKTGINSTPITSFYKNGKELSSLYRIEGALPDKVIINKLQTLKYIKQK